MNTYSDPRQSLGFLLHQSAINWRRALASELRSIDLTPVQFFMLGSTSRLTRSSSQSPMPKDVAKNTGIDINVISQVGRQLEKQELLLREQDEHDARALRLSLTDGGRTKLHEAIAIVRKVDEAFFSDAVHDVLSRELTKFI